jgi:hypothetical protein
MFEAKSIYLKSNPAVISTLHPDIPMTTTSTFIPEPTNTLVSTATLISLLSPEPNESKDVLQQLLMNQGLCKSPCFWGITPDRTTLGEAQNIFNSLGLDLIQTSQEGEMVFYATSFGLENGVVTSVVLRVQNNLIDSIRTNIGFTNYEGSLLLQEALAFSPVSIQIQYDAPTYVEFYISRAPNDGSSLNTVSYVMTTYYDSSDLVVEYKSKSISDENIIKICPLTDNFESVSVWHGKNAKNAPLKEGISLEKATPLSLEEFAGLVAEEPDNSCFDLNREHFP